MSDSEDEFASADEGEVGTSSKHPDKKPVEVKKEAESTDKNDKLAKSGKKGNSEKGDPTEGKKKKDVKQAGAASKSQQASSSTAGKGKQSGKKGKSGKKGGKEPKAQADEPSVSADQTVKEDIKVAADAKAESSSDIPKANTKDESEAHVKDVEKTPESGKDDAKKPDPESESGKHSPEVAEESGNKLSADKDASDTKHDNGDDNGTPVKSKTTASTEEAVSEPSDLIKSPSTQSIPRLEPDHSQEQENVLSRLADSAQEKKQSGWGWGWGSSILNVASSSVNTFTSQVGEGFNTMLETVESTLNVPAPEDLVKKKEEGKEQEDSEAMEASEGASPSASKDEEENPSKEDKQEEEKKSSAEAENQPKDDSSNSWFSSWGVGNITKMVESTGKTLVTGSLDVLETLGKKTMDAINEHDPGFKKTRGLIKERGDKPNLSAMLRDARDNHEAQVKMEKESEEAQKAHFGTLFDDFQGLAHLEALEILSNQSEKKVNSLLTALPQEAMTSLKPALLEIKENFEIGEDEEDEEVDEHDFGELVSDIYGKLNVGITSDKLTRTQNQIRGSLKEFSQRAETEEKPASKEIHQVAIKSLAEFTSKCIEQFHKSGEMILLHKAESTDFVSSSKLLHSLTKVMCTEIGILSTKFTESLNNNTASDDSTNTNQLVTSVYLEASNSSSYVQDGFQLLLPVLQQAAIEKNQEPVS